MDNNTLQIKVSSASSSDSKVVYHKGQNVKFINVLSILSIDGMPSKINYADARNVNAVAVLNYEDYNQDDYKFQIYQGYAPIYKSENLTCDIFRREISTKIVNGQTVLDKPLTKLELIAENIQEFSFQDYKISNNRTYEYVFYPMVSSDLLLRQEKIVKTNWDSWSITELHPVDSTGKIFYATSNDVWLFKFNVETGDQSQNFTRNENITLGTYPRYYEGRQNYISGNVSCLLGSEMVSASYLIKNGFDGRDDPYLEYRKFNTHPTSNQRVDMLNDWRKIVKSKNPKLLKDRKGQNFVITITQSSNKPYDNIRHQPDVINFSWTEIKSIDEIQIISKTLN